MSALEPNRQATVGERGSTLLVAMITLTMITLVAVSVYDLSAFDAQMTGAEIGAANALYVAEAGLHTAITDLVETYGMVATDGDLTDNVASLPGPYISSGTLNGFRQLYGVTNYRSPSTNAVVGNYQVGVRIDPASNTTVIIRCVGIGQAGTRRVVEAIASTSP